MTQDLDFNPLIYEKDEKGRLRYKMTETRLKRLRIPYRYTKLNIKTNIDDKLDEHLFKFPEKEMNSKSFYFVGNLDVTGVLISRVARYYGSFIGVNVLFTTVEEVGSACGQNINNIEQFMSADVLCVANFGNDYFSDFNKSILNFGRIVKHRYNNLLPTYYASDKNLNALQDENYMGTNELKMIYLTSQQIDVLEVE